MEIVGEKFWLGEPWVVVEEEGRAGGEVVGDGGGGAKEGDEDAENVEG